MIFFADAGICSKGFIFKSMQGTWKSIKCLCRGHSLTHEDGLGKQNFVELKFKCETAEFIPKGAKLFCKCIQAAYIP